MDNRHLPEEHETVPPNEWRDEPEFDGPFFETPLGELCLVAAIAACAATLFALIGAVIGG